MPYTTDTFQRFIRAHSEEQLSKQLSPSLEGNKEIIAASHPKPGSGFFYLQN